jgi:arylformamidase
MYKLLSYVLNETDYGWPGAPTLKIKPFESMEKGDLLNTYMLELFNHFGSHMDGPRHFNKQGKRLFELPLETFVFEAPLLLEIPKDFKEAVLVKDLLPYQKEIGAADLLMIRSGFSRYRHSEGKRYASEGPYIASETAKYLVTKFENLKAIALDWISLGSYAYGDESVLAHQHMLGKFGCRGIGIIEDISFEDLDGNNIKRIFALPLLVEGIDSAPVTVLAELED